MTKVLVVIDMQNDFIDGSLGTKEAQAIVENVVNKVYAHDYDELCFTQDTHFSNYLETQEGKNLPIPHCIYGTKGWELQKDLNAVAERGDVYVAFKDSFGVYPELFKESFSDYYADGLEFEVVGLCTDICVISNVLILKALFPEAKITIDSSCCAGVTPEKHEAALEVMRSCQIEVI
jgi:nicotinamidase-related amidase